MDLNLWIPKIVDELILTFGIFLVVIVIEQFWGAKLKIDLNFFINILGAIVLITIGSSLVFYAQSFLPFSMIKKSVISNKYLHAFSFIFLYDFCYYFFHRLQHKWKPLWMIHKFHHTDSNMNVLTSHRTHFLERAIQVVIIVFPLYFILGYNIESLRLIFYFTLFFLFYSHINIQIPHYGLTKVFVGPSVHRVHHSKDKKEYNSNFAQIFPLFDILFGTFHLPPKKKIITGIASSKSPKSQIKTMLWPILGKNTDK
jgi:sterol desaturase/sphingolipid hydroxylase (fatty acid hydroxylase superfamily)